MRSLINVDNNRTILKVEVINMVSTSMTDKKNKHLSKNMVAYHIIKMAEGIPDDLLDIFIPHDADGLVQLELNIVRWLARSADREKVIRLQRRENLPLRPNQSLRDVSIRLKILELKKKRNKFDKGNDFFPDKDK